MLSALVAWSKLAGGTSGKTSRACPATAGQISPAATDYPTRYPPARPSMLASRVERVGIIRPFLSVMCEEPSALTGEQRSNLAVTARRLLRLAWEDPARAATDNRTPRTG